MKEFVSKEKLDVSPDLQAFFLNNYISNYTFFVESFKKANEIYKNLRDYELVSDLSNSIQSNQNLSFSDQVNIFEVKKEKLRLANIKPEIYKTIKTLVDSEADLNEIITTFRKRPDFAAILMRSLTTFKKGALKVAIDNLWLLENVEVAIETTPDLSKHKLFELLSNASQSFGRRDLAISFILNFRNINQNNLCAEISPLLIKGQTSPLVLVKLIELHELKKTESKTALIKWAIHATSGQFTKIDETHRADLSQTILTCYGKKALETTFPTEKQVPVPSKTNSSTTLPALKKNTKYIDKYGEGLLAECLTNIAKYEKTPKRLEEIEAFFEKYKDNQLFINTLKNNFRYYPLRELLIRNKHQKIIDLEALLNSGNSAGLDALLNVQDGSKESKSLPPIAKPQSALHPAVEKMPKGIFNRIIVVGAGQYEPEIIGAVKNRASELNIKIEFEDKRLTKSTHKGDLVLLQIGALRHHRFYAAKDVVRKDLAMFMELRHTGKDILISILEEVARRRNEATTPA